MGLRTQSALLQAVARSRGTSSTFRSGRLVTCSFAPGLSVAHWDHVTWPCPPMRCSRYVAGSSASMPFEVYRATSRRILKLFTSALAPLSSRSGLKEPDGRMVCFTHDQMVERLSGCMMYVGSLALFLVSDVPSFDCKVFQESCLGSNHTI